MRVTVVVPCVCVCVCVSVRRLTAVPEHLGETSLRKPQRSLWRPLCRPEDLKYPGKELVVGRNVHRCCDILQVLPRVCSCYWGWPSA